jgi:hypothetical protein
MCAFSFSIPFSLNSCFISTTRESIGFAWTAKKNKTAVKPKPKPKKVTHQEGALLRSRWNDEQWEELYRRLEEYKQKHGDTLVPRKYEEDPELALFVETQVRILHWVSKSCLRSNSLDSPVLLDLFVLNVEPQRVVWNREWNKEYRETSGYAPELNGQFVDPGTDTESRASPSSATAASAGMATDRDASMAAALYLPEPVGVVAPDQGVVAEDAAELAVVMGDDGMHGDVESQRAIADAALAYAMEEEAKPPAKILTQDRKDRLDALGFVFSLRSKRIDDHWEEMFRQVSLHRRQESRSYL